jgi:membrane associated rhomboid family serine protease
MVIPIRDENPTHRFPIVTIALIAVNLFVYFAVQLPKDSNPSPLFQDHTEGEDFVYEYAAVPCELEQGEPLNVAEIATGECDAQERFSDPRAAFEPFADKNVYLAVLFSMFMHGSILHVLGNMLFLWIFGNNVEDRLGPIGYVGFYLVTGLAASAAHIGFNLDSAIPVVGASGAIAGVMGAYIVWFPHARVMSLVPLFLFFTFVELPALVVLGLWFVLQFFTNPNEGVAWLAHVGGFVAGAAIAFALSGVLGPPRAAPRRPPPAWGRRWPRRDDGWSGWGDYRDRF